MVVREDEAVRVDDEAGARAGGREAAAGLAGGLYLHDRAARPRVHLACDRGGRGRAGLERLCGERAVPRGRGGGSAGPLRGEIARADRGADRAGAGGGAGEREGEQSGGPGAAALALVGAGGLLRELRVLGLVGVVRLHSGVLRVVLSVSTWRTG